MVNAIDWSMLTDDSMMDDGQIAARVKAWVFVSFVLSFSGVIGSIWILVQEIQAPSFPGGWIEPAVRCLLQNIFLFGSSLFRCCRVLLVATCPALVGVAALRGWW